MLSNTKHTWDTTSRKLWKPQQAWRKERFWQKRISKICIFWVMKCVLSNIDIIVIAAGEWFIVKHDFHYFNILTILTTFWWRHRIFHGMPVKCQYRDIWGRVLSCNFSDYTWLRWTWVSSPVWIIGLVMALSLTIAVCYNPGIPLYLVFTKQAGLNSNPILLSR